MFFGRRSDSPVSSGRVVDYANSTDPRRLMSRLRSVLNSSDYQPPVLPAVAVELLSLSRDVNVPFSKVTTLVKTEPLIAAKVLRLARSATYSRGTPIASLDEAVARLGLRTLGDLFLQESMTTRVFRASGYQEPMEALKLHSTAVAGLARTICRRKSLPDEYAYMCGLLHDVGVAAGILIVADVGRGEPAPPYELVQDAIEAVHAEASEVLARAWDLPEDIQAVLRHHHDVVAVEGEPNQLASAVALADAIVSELGASAGREVPEEQVRLAARQLALHPTELGLLRQEAVKQLDQLRASG